MYRSSNVKDYLKQQEKAKDQEGLESIHHNKKALS